MDSNVALVQDIYFLVTGIWPVISMNTFIKITGPRMDLWLVKTVGLILATIGAVLIYPKSTDNINPPVILPGVGSALSLTLAEFIYVIKGVISPVYLADAFVEILFWWALAAWLA